jgi:type IV pilus assembly protein PilC
MTRFYYTAADQSGKSYTEEMDAPDRFAVYDAVRKTGGRVLSVREGKRGLSWQRLKTYTVFGSVSLSEKIMFSRNLATMITAGLPLSRALLVAQRQTRNVIFKKKLEEIANEITQGKAFHEALEKAPDIFPSFYLAMVKAGEESGGLAETLRTLCTQMERTYTLRKKVRGAMIYPAIILLAMSVIGVLMLIMVVPTLTKTFAEMNVDLPQTTQMIIGVSNFLLTNSLVAVGLFIAIIAAFFFALRSRLGTSISETIILHLPIISRIVKETNAARTARTLSSLLTSGVDVVRALSITQEVIQNGHYRRVLVQAQKNVEQGQPLSKSFLENEHLYPALMGEIASVGEETGQLSSMMEEIADFYEEEVEQKTKDMSTVIEPFLVLFIGGVVGFFALAMLSPIYSLSGSL